jgi:6-pyruvoyltetrahydropterin/6-carboxytetrahydropterin synthase
MMYVSRRARFSASHRLHNPELTDEENARLFGACNHEGGHGHNYEVEIVVRGEPDPRTGMFINLRDLKEILDEEVVRPLDYRSLDEDRRLLRGRISTTENLARAIWEALVPRLPPDSLHLVRVRESENNAVEYTGPMEATDATIHASGSPRRARP